MVTLVGGLTRTRAAPGPLPDEAVLLADPGFVLEPDLDPPAFGDIRQMRLQRGGEVFLNADIVSAFWPGWRGRALMWEKPICFKILPTLRG